jgi:hypothetical protein
MKLEDAVIEQRLMSVEVLPALHASKCEYCGVVFSMKAYGDHAAVGELRGIFEYIPGKRAVRVTDGDCRDCGNIFSAACCSFACADQLYRNECWKKIEYYKPFADAEMRLMRVEFHLSRDITFEADLRAKWLAARVK